MPYCSRCTQVVVNSVHDVIEKAKSIGKLRGRIEKKYLCFLPDKEVDSTAHSQIIHASCSTHTRRAPYISKFIEQEIRKIPQAEIDHAREKGFPCVLIAGPSHYTKQVYDYLKNSFTNIDYADAKNQDVEFLEGYKILAHDENSNLGWRIILECSRLRQKADIIKTTHESKQRLTDLLPSDFRIKHLAIVALLTKLKSGETLSESEVQELVTECNSKLKKSRNF